MPRPGSRPYECVKRAWHSEKHQPMRGSLIQEIFRLVNEMHSSATKKNKEWQVKLPIVVLKAEDILYSKANSEAEYMDLTTLWDRANDAINTIIRRDESTESGDFLLPCIEASLHLGCTPRRASRSQRDDNPGGYLSARTQNANSVTTPNLEHATRANYSTNGQFMSHYSSFIKPTIMNFNSFISKSQIPVFQNTICPADKSPLLPVDCLSHGNYLTHLKSNSYSICPLYNGDQLQSKHSELGFGNPSISKCYSLGPRETDFAQKPSSCNADTSNKVKVDFRDTSEIPPELGCDLSLRLGPLAVPCISFENSWPQEVEDVGSSTSREMSQCSDPISTMDKDFSFCLSKGEFGNVNLNVDATVRKRKAVLNQPSEAKQFCWQPKLPINHFNRRMSNAGS